MIKVNDHIKLSHRNLAVDELAAEPITVIIGVSAEIAEFLKTFGITTIFDLGVSQLFQTARTLADVVIDQRGPISRFQQIPRELLDIGVSISDIKELVNIRLSELRSLDASIAQGIEEKLGLHTLDELGRWSPYLVAKELIEDSLVDNDYQSDPEIPDELVPRFNEYPTEKSFYSVYTIDSNAKGDKFRPLSGPLNLAEIDKKEQDLQVCTGAIVRYEQAWMPVGLALGNLLHSLALAPAESTQVAMIDWSRRQGVSTSETISQNESLANSQMHSRSINEVTRAVAREAQNGFSQMNANSTVSNTANSSYGLQNSGEALSAGAAGATAGLVAGGAAGAAGGAGVGAIAGLAGAGFGAIPGAIAGGLIGGGAGGLIGLAGGGVAGFLGAAEFGASQGNTSETATEVVTTTSSSGEREIAASMAQNITDRTQQHSSSARNRRATIVQEVWQNESEEITTRTVTNYNHMHALTVQYFEVVQMYRLRTAVDNIQRALYIPMKSLRWTKSNIERYRAILIRNAIDLRVITSLALPPKTVSFSFPMLGSIDAVTARNFSSQNEPNWGLEYARKVVEGQVANMPLEPWVLPRDVVIDDYRVGRYIRSNSQSSVFQEFESYGTKATRGVEGAALSTIQNLEWLLPARDEEEAETLNLDVVINFSYKNEKFFSVFPLVLSADIYPSTTDGVTIPIGVLDQAPEESWLADHLTMFTKHYSRAVWQSVDVADITTLLSDYTYEGVPVIDYIDRKPVAISGQYLVFAYHYKPEQKWNKWLRQHGFMANDTTKVELLPMPTGGVFAEAIQGRANSAEKLDMTRFWNWQDSPIPFKAPEIAAVNAGSRATDSNLLPGQLQAPIVNNLSLPGIPDPQGIGAALSAVSNGNMFRNMSGIAEARSLASDALQQAQAGATAAGQQSSSNLAQGMEMHSKAIDKILSMFQDLSNQISGTGFGIMSGNLGSKDISSSGAIVNQAKALDLKNATSSLGRNSSGGNSSGGNSSGGNSSGEVLSQSLEDKALSTLISGSSFPTNGINTIDTSNGVEFASNSNRSAILVEAFPKSLQRLPELLTQAETGQWFVNGELRRVVTPGEVYGNLLVVFPVAGQIVYLDGADNALYRTDYNTFFKQLVSVQALASGGARAEWLDQVARVEFELMIGAIFGIPEIIAIRTLGFLQALNMHQEEAGLLIEHFPALLEELKWFSFNFPLASLCIVANAVWEVFKNVPSAVGNISVEKWAYLLGRFLKGSIASEGAKNLLSNLFFSFSLTLGAFTALTVVPQAGIDLIEEQAVDLQNKLKVQGIEIEIDCLKTTLNSLLNHDDKNELRLRLDRIAKSAESLMPAMKKLFLESGSTLI